MFRLMKLTVSDYTRFLLRDKPTQKKRAIGNFVIDEELSSDTWRVFAAHHKRNDKQVIIKQLHPFFTTNSKNFKKYKTEVTSLLKLRHPHIAQLYSVAQLCYHAVLVIEDGGKNNVPKYIQMQGKLDEDEARRLFCQMVGAVSCIHKAGMVHRNLVPENFCLDENKNIKIIGFGRSSEIDFKHEIDSSITNDIWALGLVLHFMLTGQYTDKSKDYLMCDPKHVIPEASSKEVSSLLSEIFLTKSSKELTIQSLLDHPWVKQSYIEPLASYVPEYPELFVDTKQSRREEGIELDYVIEKIRHDAQQTNERMSSLRTRYLTRESPASKEALIQLTKDVASTRQENTPSKFKPIFARINKVFGKRTAGNYEENTT